MSNKTLVFVFLIVFSIVFSGCTQKDKTISKEDNQFVVNQPNYELSPYTGMTRQHWIDAATYLLDGAFSYIHTLDDAMKFPKQHDKTYPNSEEQVPTEKLEGLCRTLFVAAPLLRENPDLVLNNIKVADYYRHQLLNLINPESPSFIKHRTGGPSQILVEFGALAISLSIIPEIIWEPFTQEQKDELAATMLSYGDGPTINSNWRFFNIFIQSFFKDQGYTINEDLLIEYLEKTLAFYRGQGWYNDAPAYDYYSMWAFQMYGPVWSELYGKKYYPEYAQQFMSNLADLVDNYPYMFNEEGKMNMWGRSICYRFGAIAPLPLTGFLTDSSINFGWFRQIASSTILQFLENPAFLEDNVPTLGFYGPFEPAVQIYSCRGSVYWCGKAFLGLLLAEDHPFWTSVENRGPWEKEFKKGTVYNKFQEGSNLLITDYPNSGAAEMRSWCHEKVADDWQKFRSTENYNKLAYNTEFPWMADGKNGEVSMNYAIKNMKDEWEVLRLYTFLNFEDGIYRRDVVLETNEDIKFQLADIPLPDGILRVDKVYTPIETEIRLGHYSLALADNEVKGNDYVVDGTRLQSIANDKYELIMMPLYGWEENPEQLTPYGLHPVSDYCATLNLKDRLGKEKVYITLQLWKKGGERFTEEELTPVKKVNVSEDKKRVDILFSDNTQKIIQFN